MLKFQKTRLTSPDSQIHGRRRGVVIWTWADWCGLSLTLVQIGEVYMFTVFKVLCLWPRWGVFPSESARLDESSSPQIGFVVWDYILNHLLEVIWCKCLEWKNIKTAFCYIVDGRSFVIEKKKARPWIINMYSCNELECFCTQSRQISSKEFTLVTVFKCKGDIFFLTSIMIQKREFWGLWGYFFLTPIFARLCSRLFPRGCQRNRAAITVNTCRTMLLTGQFHWRERACGHCVLGVPGARESRSGCMGTPDPTLQCHPFPTFSAVRPYCQKHWLLFIYFFNQCLFGTSLRRLLSLTQPSSNFLSGQERQR